jgi:hypothetical protein
MLTDYMVTCPRPDCGWTGSLLPSRNQDAWKSAMPATQTIVFHCPRCQRDWTAHLIGDNLVKEHYEEFVAVGR